MTFDVCSKHNVIKRPERTPRSQPARWDTLAAVKQVVDGVWHLNTMPVPNTVNAYLLEDVLVDAGARQSRRAILRQLKGHRVSVHALTHAHPDHQGSSHAVCEELGIPFWVPERDADAAEDPDLIRERQPNHPVARFYLRVFIGPGHPVDRLLKEGDEVAGFEVIDVPGHSAGHVALWRASDRVLVLGDVLSNMDQVTLIPGLHEPKPYLTPDPAENRRSAKKLAQLEPELVLFGHGAPLRDTGKFVDFVEALPGA
jgi:glyoxylase-like metal-dependent hydrolase (beta-lactamase superfamily II)